MSKNSMHEIYKQLYTWQNSLLISTLQTNYARNIQTTVYLAILSINFYTANNYAPNTQTTVYLAIISTNFYTANNYECNVRSIGRIHFKFQRNLHFKQNFYLMIVAVHYSHSMTTSSCSGQALTGPTLPQWTQLSDARTRPSS